MKKENLPAKIVNISTDEAGRRIDNFLRFQFKSLPKSMIYRLLRKGAIRVNKKPIKPEYKLVTGDKLRIPPIQVFKCKNKKISPFLKKIAILPKVILHEDDQIIVMNKPSGIAVHGGSGLSFGIIEGLRALRPKIGFLELVHRLDQDTSGVLLIAKKYSALRSLHEQLREKKIKKDYLALARGRWKSRISFVKVPLLKNVLKSGERIVKVNKKGKFSETYFKVEENYASFATLVRCRPITGRTHQIRVHMQYAGHPIALDNRYGDQKFNKRLLQIGLSRLFLHATSVEFLHPRTGETVCFKASLDEQLNYLLKILRN